MTGRLSPPLSRALALAILLALVAGLYYGVAAPLAADYAGDSAAIAQLRDALARYRRAADELPARRVRLAALERQRPAAEGFLQGKNDTLIAAQIQNRIKRLTDVADADLESTQVLPPQADGKLTRIAVRGRMAATIGGMLRVFHDLEAGSPLLFLDNVEMRVRPVSRWDRRARSAGEIIGVQFDVYGYINSGG